MPNIYHFKRYKSKSEDQQFRRLSQSNIAEAKMSAHPKITVIHSTETSWRGDRSRGRAREPIPPPPPTPPGLPRRSEASQRSIQSSPSPPPPQGRTYIVEPKESGRTRHADIPKKRTVRFLSGIPLPFTSRRRSISEVPKREFVLVRRRHTTQRSHSPEPPTVRQPVHPRPSARSPSHERPEVISAPFQQGAGQTTQHMRDPSRQHRGGSSPQSPNYEHYPRPGFHSTGLSHEEHKRLERETRRRQDAEIIAQETAEALVRAQRELAQREREHRRHEEEAARLRAEAEDRALTQQEAQRETERRQNAERIALARAEDAARAQRELAQRERERCQRSEQAVRATRENLAHIQREAEIMRRERDEAIRRNSELKQLANMESERQQAMRRQHEEVESEASERVEKDLQRAREQAEKYAAESERLRRARATGIPRSPRHQVALHQPSGGRNSLEERDERFTGNSAHTGNRRMVDRTMPTPRRDTRRDSGVSGGRGSFEERGDRFIDEAIQAENRRREERNNPRLRRIDRTVYDDDSLRRGRRWA